MYQNNKGNGHYLLAQGHFLSLYDRSIHKICISIVVLITMHLSQFLFGQMFDHLDDVLIIS
jgi:hypothetical protein